MLQAYLGKLAQLDYPYPVEFIGSALPANPVELACSRFSAARAAGVGVLSALQAAASVSYNYTLVLLP